jgi:hypothetical protein
MPPVITTATPTAPNSTIFNPNTSYWKNSTADDHASATANFVYYAFFASAMATAISLFNVGKHLANYTKPELQKSITRILFIVPFYAVFSFLGLADHENSLIYESVRDVYESLVIYEFLKLILAYCGGENACLQVIMHHPGTVEHIWPFNYCFRRMTLDAKFMRRCKQYALQFVIIKPIMAAVNIIMLEIGQYRNSVYQNAQLILYNISYSFALYVGPSHTLLFRRIPTRHIPN